MPEYIGALTAIVAGICTLSRRISLSRGTLHVQVLLERRRIPWVVGDPHFGLASMRAHGVGLLEHSEVL